LDLGEGGEDSLEYQSVEDEREGRREEA